MNISKIHNVIEQENIIFSYSGYISQRLIEFLIDDLEIEFNSLGKSKTFSKKVFLVLIEQLQNIMNYSKRSKENLNISELVIVAYDKEKEKYYICTTNEIEKKAKKIISEKIDFANNLNENEKVKYQQNKLRQEQESSSKGAGVGFIEISKKSSEKIEYCFEEKNTKTYFHVLIYI